MREVENENAAAATEGEKPQKRRRSADAGVKPGAASHNERLKQSKNGRIKKTRRRERVLMGSAAVLLLALALICLLFFFKVQEIAVVDSAQQRYTNEEILEASGLNAGDSMLWLREEAASQRITEKLPFLQEAKVKKRFPSRVEISVTYARPAMAIKADAGYILLSADGKVLQTGVSALSDYVAELRGAEVSEAQPGKNVEFKDPELFSQVVTLVRAFSDAGYLNVTVYDVSDLQNITVEVDYKVDVKLGNIAKVEGKLAFGKEVIERSLAESKHSVSKVVVDLTTENTAFVRSQADIDARTTVKAGAGGKTQPAPDAEENTEEADEDGGGYDDDGDYEDEYDGGYDDDDDRYDDDEDDYDDDE